MAGLAVMRGKCQEKNSRAIQYTDWLLVQESQSRATYAFKQIPE